jgi:hypothetical protein
MVKMILFLSGVTAGLAEVPDFLRNMPQSESPLHHWLPLGGHIVVFLIAAFMIATCLRQNNSKKSFPGQAGRLPETAWRFEPKMVLEQFMRRVGRAVEEAAAFIGRLQTGQVQTYAAALVLGICGLLYFMLRKA